MYTVSCLHHIVFTWYVLARLNYVAARFKHAAEILKHFQTCGMFAAQTYDLKCHGEN